MFITLLIIVVAFFGIVYLLSLNKGFVAWVEKSNEKLLKYQQGIIDKITKRK